MDSAIITLLKAKHTIMPQTRLESITHYIFIATLILAPLIFISSPYSTFDLIKTVVIALGVLVSAILYALISMKERRIVLPPKSITVLVVLQSLSMLISSLLSSHPAKSLFGQGFEVTTASFGLLMFVAGLVAYTLVQRRPERAVVIYAASVGVFVLLLILHTLRFIFGANFASFSVLNTLTSTFIGTWYELAIYAILIVFILLAAVIFLPLSRRTQIIYWIVILGSAFGAFIINSSRVWAIASIVFAILFATIFVYRRRVEGGGRSGFLRRIAWIPLIGFVVAIGLLWKGTIIATPLINSLKASHLELSLPWQMTLDVASESVKNNPFFGVGPNRFTNAFIAYKPTILNQTNVWNVEFNTGFGRIPSVMVTQGVVGYLLWILFFVFFGIHAVRSLRNLPDSQYEKFILVSSYTGSIFMWLMNIFYTPSHALLLLTFVLTGVALASSVAYGKSTAFIINPVEGGRNYKLIPSLSVILIVIALAWGAVYLKKTVALAYFNSGIKAMTGLRDPIAADKSFARALALDNSDIYWQARSEATLAKVNQLIATTSSQTSIPQSVADELATLMNEALTYANRAVAYDPTNYYNYISEARVSEAATTLGMSNGYENAVQAYVRAINVNPQNPALYLSLARLQASQNKLDEALQSVGASLRVKNNYLDAIYLFSQIAAAQGNLSDAITAAEVATELNPQNPVLFFQLGLLRYNNRNYSGAAQALEKAVQLQPNYANAQYFLGLSYTRLGKNADAITQFESLTETNPENQEVAFILSNLRAGKSPFSDAEPPVTPPEKRSSLPVKEKSR